jgi:hypothetical protein
MELVMTCGKVCLKGLRKTKGYTSVRTSDLWANKQTYDFLNMKQEC